MKFEFEGLSILMKIFDEGTIDDDLFTKFVSCNDFKEFIYHEKVLGRKTSENSIKENIISTLKGAKDIREAYDFNFVLEYKNEIKFKIKEIKNNSIELENLIRKRVSRYAPLDIYGDDFTIKLYAGGPDYGFSEREGECYINLALLADKIEFLEDIMAHEYYHSRKRKEEIQPYDFSKEKYLKTLMYHIMEEGIATLVQFEYEKKHEGFAFISKERFDEKMNYMDKLDKCIRECELNNNYSQEVVMEYFQDSIPNYIVGYWIGQILFKEYGKAGLELWNRNCDYISSFKNFISILRRDNLNSGLSKEVEDYILSLK